MSTLHVLSHSPFTDSRLTSCLRLLGPQDALLLCGDAVYALQPGSAPLAALQAREALALYVLAEDQQARGLDVPAWATSVDYPAFVALSIHYDKVNSWL
ncbi:sulfurtransferase complex subunit TusB [Pseudomonas chlororaphis]|uniref:Sulfur relay protein DsrH n=1 Tax=Pseudomonas chlororaphis TaxID=587753 RepID=A0A1Q8EN43_9PSED|nr:sulfurtransferase complex subunit TusB [Pseudomonas chlororaphis]OLF53222.1 sulfur relay protein DsrH [Pseudomonas chlororaphis]